MEKLDIEFKNCYGITKMKHCFDFTNKRIYVVYAPNGIMKTSFANTFRDLSKGEESRDLIFANRVTKRIINDENDTEISREQIFVIEPYIESYKSEKISTLLVNKELKRDYEQIHLNIDEMKEKLIKGLKPLSGLRSTIIEDTISNDIAHTLKKFFEAIIRIKPDILNKNEPEYENIKYQKIFSDKVVSFLETKDLQTKLAEYIDTYDKLIDESKYFKKGVFNHNNASVIAKQLKDNGFFEASHSVNLNSDESKKEITTVEELEKEIQEEKESILSNPDLAKVFEKIDSKLKSNKELRDFREYLIENQSIVVELSNLLLFREKLWISYLKRNVELYKSLLDEYERGKKKIEDIVNKAKSEETEWRKVIDIFNKRFKVPFELSVENQEDVILKSEGPSIKFEFHDNVDKKFVEEMELLKVLSSGEKKALYLLNIIFEVEVRKQNEQDTLFIVDDIADSFDYKNKYAIIEYLKDISNENIFKQILLTHNYDFFRTISSRLDMERENKLYTIKTTNEIKLIEEKYQKNPFDTWKKHLHENESMLVASIPFVRNIADFSGYDDQSNKLTSLLHIKEDTNDYLIKDLESIHKEIIRDLDNLSLPSPDKKILDLIFETADNILSIPEETVELENKIALAIAIRLKAEHYMITEINDNDFCSCITKNQTFELFTKFRDLYSTKTNEIELLDQVNLMTPENIHLNSFMYEPILDMSNEHLKSLYKEIKAI